ncbi:hypothetical protein [Amycolatopsis xylanica]|uniref:hypothetical protein n=1 Tax=Amycolatopsis xylanica TaxID=589385 RepID=UPI001FE0A690|nr:hypothetical protein [Amycolatopsis xylanica]
MSVTEAAGVRGLVLACGPDTEKIPDVDEVRTVRLPSRPGKADVDPLLGESDRLIVGGSDADLAAVVLRLLRKEQLAGVSVGFVPTDPESAVAEIWGLPTDPLRALALAVRGDVDPVPLIRDDAGGVLVGRGQIPTVRGVAYCDEKLALRGPARSIEVEPSGSGPGLAVRVVKGAFFKRPSDFESRAFQLGCIPTRPVYDGVVHPRALNRWTWYRHTEDLRLVRGVG